LSGGAPDTIRADGGRPGGTWASSRDLGMSSRTTSSDWKRIDGVVDVGNAGVEDVVDVDTSSHALTEAIASKHCDADIMQASCYK
jgi:hypothetical protein